MSNDELAAESAMVLPAKEVISLLDLNVDLDIALDLAAPIDLAVAANANVAAPITGAVGANVLSEGSTAETLSDQGVAIDQHLSGEAIATAPQTSSIDQSDDDPGTDPGEDPVPPEDPGGILDGDLLNIDVNVALDADLAAPVAGAVAANANVAAPISAAVGANALSVDSTATAISQQDAIINQNLEDVVAEATAEQQAEITQ